MNLSYKNTIRYKLTKAIMRILVISLAILIITALVGMFTLRRKTESLLINQALDSAVLFTEGKSDTYSGDIDNIVSKMEQLADYCEYLYLAPEEFVNEKMLMPAEFPDNVTYATIHWVPFFEEDLQNQAILDEANLLSSLKHEFFVLLKNSPMIYSVYMATTTHINVGYDTNVNAKKGIFFNPSANEDGWFPQTLKLGDTYISDTYIDSFGNGLIVTIAVPYYVDGEIRGVLGADISLAKLNQEILEIRTGTDGYAILLSSDFSPITAEGLTETTTVDELLGSETDNIISHMAYNNSGTYKSVINGADVYVVFSKMETTSWYLATILPVASITGAADESNTYIWTIISIYIAISVIIFVVMIFVTKKISSALTDPLKRLTTEAIRVGSGNLDYTNVVQTSDELQLLGESFEHMTVSLKTYINELTNVTAEKERIGAELNVATQIQSSMLPTVTPYFAEHKQFQIAASMTPAKEVGGDFYDFFMIDDYHLACVVADVSGKGVPAALFMVIGKTLIKDHSNQSTDMGEIFTNVNNLLCESNSSGLFITAFECVIDLRNGEMRYVNAGHEMPYIMNEGSFEPQKIRPGFVLAGMEGIKYRSGVFQLKPGDKFFQYTDGVTEATDANNELFGQARLTETLHNCYSETPSDVIKYVTDSIHGFVKEAPQFDDITMLCFEFKEYMIEDPKYGEENTAS